MTKVSVRTACVTLACFFDRPDFDLSSAQVGTYAVMPTLNMIDALRRDYASTTAMIFGEPPAFRGHPGLGPRDRGVG